MSSQETVTSRIVFGVVGGLLACGGAGLTVFLWLPVFERLTIPIIVVCTIAGAIGGAIGGHDFVDKIADSLP